VSSKKIVRVTALIAVKESYLFLRNLYGLATHPFLTLKRIERQKDRSQFFLLASFVVSPLLFIGGAGLLSLVAVKLLPQFRFYIKTGFWFFSGGAVLFFFGLAGWFIYWLEKVKSSKKQ